MNYSVFPETDLGLIKAHHRPAKWGPGTCTWQDFRIAMDQSHPIFAGGWSSVAVLFQHCVLVCGDR